MATLEEMKALVFSAVSQKVKDEINARGLDDGGYKNVIESLYTAINRGVSLSRISAPNNLLDWIKKIATWA